MVDLEEGQRAKEKYAFGARVCNNFVLLFNIRVQQQQFNFLVNAWTEDALSTALHSVLTLRTSSQADCRQFGLGSHTNQHQRPQGCMPRTSLVNIDQASVISVKWDVCAEPTPAASFSRLWDSSIHRHSILWNRLFCFILWNVAYTQLCFLNSVAFTL